MAVATLALAALLFYLQLREGNRQAPPVVEPRAGQVPDPAPRPDPRSSAAAAVVRSVQSRALALPLQRGSEPRLAFGRGVIARLTEAGVTLHALPGGELAVERPLEQPRAVLSLADGAILAIGAREMVRLEADKKPTLIARPVLLPGAAVFADAQVGDRLWIFEAQRRPPTLSSFRLEGAGERQGVPLPEQVIELDAEPGGTVGRTREGVWLYFGAERAERIGPGGARLSSLRLPSLPERFAILPARRLDQAQLLTEDGTLLRALVSPTFKRLSEGALTPSPFSADVGDEGRLLAVVAVTGPGPRFELFTFDEKLAPGGRAALPSDAPTGREDWVQVVSQNQQLAVAPHKPLIAVGGPKRLLLFDERAQQILSIPSR